MIFLTVNFAVLYVITSLHLSLKVCLNKLGINQVDELSIDSVKKYYNVMPSVPIYKLNKKLTFVHVS